MLPPLLQHAIALELIHRLGTEDAFRALFIDDPAAALVAAGVPAPDAAELALCCGVHQLADKQDILAAALELKTMLTAQLSQTVPALDANPGGSHTLKGP